MKVREFGEACQYIRQNQDAIVHTDRPQLHKSETIGISQHHAVPWFNITSAGLPRPDAEDGSKPWRITAKRVVPDRKATRIADSGIQRLLMEGRTTLLFVE